MNRIRYIVSILAILLLALPAVTANAQQSDDDIPYFDGIWETSLGTMALWQAEDVVWGIFEPVGTIAGKIQSDGVMYISYELAEDLGRGRFYMGEDGRSFEGRYQSTMDEQIHGEWNGTWLGPNTYEVGDVNALEYTGSNLPPELRDTSDITDTGTTTPEAEPEPNVIDEPESPAVASNAWTGKWDTNLGYLLTSATGNVVTGSFGDNGVLEGTVRGNNLNATWTFTEDGTELSGEAFFTISADGSSFRGTYLMEGDEVWLGWSGTRTDQVDPTREFSFGVGGSEEEEPRSETVELEPENVAITDEPVESTGSDLLNAEEIGPEVPMEEPEPETEISEPEPEPEPEITEPEPTTEEEDVFTIKLTASAECWVTLKNEDGNLFIGAMQEGDVLEFEDPVGFYVKAGRPEALEVEFNGEVIEWEEFTFSMNLPEGTIIYEPPAEDE